jgi:hypothetical protein
MTADFSFWFYDCNFELLGACNTPLERYFQDLSNGILKAPKFLKLQLVNQKKKKTCSRLTSVNQGGQTNCNGQTTVVLFYHVFY